MNLPLIRISRSPACGVIPTAALRKVITTSVKEISDQRFKPSKTSSSPFHAVPPILLLTARTEEEDKLLAFDSGADDYVEKPFNPKEIVARLQAILRRRGPAPKDSKIILSEPPVKHCLLVIDPQAHTVKIDGAEKELTAKEFDLLHTLASNPDHIFTRENLLKTLWEFDTAVDTRTVDIHIQRLRQKLEDGCCPQWRIATVWGVGYRFETGRAAAKNR